MNEEKQILAEQLTEEISKIDKEINDLAEDYVKFLYSTEATKVGYQHSVCYTSPGIVDHVFSISTERTVLELKMLIQQKVSLQLELDQNV